MEMRKSSFWILILTLILGAGCGKNQGYYPGGYAPYTQAPGYPAGYSAYPTSGYPAAGYGAFTPQLPAGYPAAYTPFLPVDYYMRQNPQTAPYWPGYWSGWVSYCNRYGYSPYDFNRFWYAYTPQQWNQGGWNQIYGYLNKNFYGWANPNIQIAVQVNPQTFWANYSGYGYNNAWSYQYSR